ncbi:N-acetylglucosamine-6-phosphate deacetylase [Bacillus sp. NRRL B-14911]|uniref:N-acetylglucosamine-6-phosphate deacetylase n=1 Tax=Bacillus infantis NRRL B-14911 TaxID=1367477 RepID=U5LFM6_9BACI|nr:MULTISPECIES: N-acetylglucosamine-6-phosphate deacetylase [Bacillus]AGX06193.1 N-acetylglucosamine-6-phosphate deacetylase [Bacillus infantis NRRL B-14911]EAR65562.1 N-acetylglucosamine-6-phosphate deacetylase [Bacillus sp. NRRL B-14911]
MSSLLLKNSRVLTEDGIIDKGYILVEDGRIKSFGPAEELGGQSADKTIELDAGATLAPGFIDLHIHGAGGADTMDSTPEALQTIARTLPAEGTTSFLATTITQERSLIEKALANAAAYKPEGFEAEMLGIHLEGPFINEKRKGAQPLEHILKSDVELFKAWQEKSGQLIRLVTLAPELEGGKELVRHLAETGVIASIGHSDADYEEVREAVEAGATHVTHLFNGMKGLHHREPGTAGAALLFKELIVEMIADGVHVRPEMIKLALNSKGMDGMVLITDSMRAKCLKNGTYDLGGQDVTVKDGMALLEDGTLAGSILRMKDSVKNMTKFADITLAEAVKLASENPAKQLKVFDRKGSIAEGKDADLTVLNENMDIVLTICRGKVAYNHLEVE